MAPSEAALLLVNLYGWLFPEAHPARCSLATIYGRDEVMRREAIVRQNILPVLDAARHAKAPVVYVADSAPNLALERTQVREVVRTHLGYDPLEAHAETVNDPHEYLRGEVSRIA